MFDSNWIKNVRLRYIIGLGTIALLVTASYVTLQTVVTKQRNYSKLLVMATQQEGLAGRIAYFTNLMANTKDVAEFGTAKSEVSQLISEMKTAHDLLRFGDPEKGIPYVTTDKLKSIYEDPVVGLDRSVSRFLDRTQDVHDTEFGELGIGFASYLFLTTYGPNVLGPKFREAVVEYELVAREAILQIEKLQFWLWCAAIFSLILEMFIIFYPMEKRIRESFEELHSTNRELEASLNELQSINANLTEAQQEVASRTHELRQAQKMEIVGQLSGGLSHDFNNILATILGNLSIIQRKISNDDALQQRIAPAIAATERGAALTKRLLSFSRKQNLDIQVVDIKSLLFNMEDLLRRSLREDIDVRFYIADNVNLCELDRIQMEQAILNLAINARDAMPDGGQLIFRAENTRFDREDADRHFAISPGEYVLLSISDTGTGIDSEIQQKVFEPFFTTKDIDKGTGLGLSMVYGFIKQSGGHISLESEINKGTTFNLFLPKSTASLSAEPDSSSVDTPGGIGGAKILVVEDNIELRNLIAESLEEFGYDVVLTGSGIDALDILAKDYNAFDLLLTDVLLPGGVKGTEVAQIALKNKPQLKILFMSGYSKNIKFDQTLGMSEFEILSKPFTTDNLGHRIRLMLQSGPD